MTELKAVQTAAEMTLFGSLGAEAGVGRASATLALKMSSRDPAEKRRASAPGRCDMDGHSLTFTRKEAKMGDTGKKDKDKRQDQKKSKNTLKEKRKQKNEKEKSNGVNEI